MGTWPLRVRQIMEQKIGRHSQVGWVTGTALLVCGGLGQSPLFAASSGGDDFASGILAGLRRSSDAQSRRASSSNADLDSNGDARTIQAGETLVLAELTGPGAITHWWNTVASQYPFSGRSLVLRIYWDGMATPT